MATIKLNNAASIALCQKNQAGVTKYFTALSTILLAGSQTTAIKINAVFQADIDATTALEAAESDVKQKRLVQKAARAAAISTRANVKKYIVGNYGSRPCRCSRTAASNRRRPPA